MASRESSEDLYRNNLKNRDFDKEAPQNSCLERATIALGQGASEDKNFEGKPTQSKTDSSGCFGIQLFLEYFINEIGIDDCFDA